MFGIGFLEICVIAVVALVFVGPSRLPEFMRQAGRFFVQARRMSSEVKSTFDHAIKETEDEIRKEEQETLHKAIQSEAERRNLHDSSQLETPNFNPSSEKSSDDNHHATEQAPQKEKKPTSE